MNFSFPFLTRTKEILSKRISKFNRVWNSIKNVFDPLVPLSNKQEKREEKEKAENRKKSE